MYPYFNKFDFCISFIFTAVASISVIFFLQVEMFLLGHTLGVTLQVFRPSQFGEEDFISYYPDDKKQVFPLVSLIAEDDRHYNVAVP